MPEGFYTYTVLHKGGHGIYAPCERLFSFSTALEGGRERKNVFQTELY